MEHFSIPALRLIFRRLPRLRRRARPLCGLACHLYLTAAIFILLRFAFTGLRTVYRDSTRYIIRHPIINNATAGKKTFWNCDEGLMYRKKSRTLTVSPEIYGFSKEEELYEPKFRDAESLLTANHTEEAIEKYLDILDHLPNSIRAHYGVARAYEKNAYHASDTRVSEESTANALTHYATVLHRVDNRLSVKDRIEIKLRKINLHEDIGDYSAAETEARELVVAHPSNRRCKARLVSLLKRNRKLAEATMVCKTLIASWPNHTMGYANLGDLAYIQGKWQDVVKYLTKVINSTYALSNPGIYYEKLGDSLRRLGRKREAIKWYEKAVKKRIFRSVYRRTTYNVYPLTNRTWWSLEDLENPAFYYYDTETRLFPRLIYLRQFFSEVISLSSFLTEEFRQASNTTEFDRYFSDTEYYQEGHVEDSVREALVYKRGYATSACETFPLLTHFFNTFPPTRRCKHCNVKYVIMKKGHIWPKCNKNNLLLTTHLALSVPSNVSISVLNETRTWTEGDLLIFDGSFEHEIWNNGTGVLVLLSFDMWNPELSDNEIQKAEEHELYEL